jgi:decaprenylphospho-beta-D-erythro-pentofuranosid-2-ulose 2-reductase
MRKVLILGATSAIAEATARRLAAAGDALYLVGRRSDRLQAVADDLRVRGGAPLAFEVLDLNRLEEHPAMIERAVQALGGLDTVLIAHGTLSDQATCQRSVEHTLAEIRTNALSVVSLLTLLAERFEVQGRGSLVVISSVAGDRGRGSNYVYGCAKAMVTSFTSGLRQRLAASGVQVLTIKPGFVDTPMTIAFPKGPLWARPDAIARGIVGAIRSQRSVVYLPGFWRLIMAVICAIPEPLFRRLSL